MVIPPGGTLLSLPPGPNVNYGLSALLGQFNIGAHTLIEKVEELEARLERQGGSEA
jgi:hypothetical protein